MINRTIKLVLIDAITASFSVYLAFLLRFEFSIPSNFLSIFLKILPWFVGIQLMVFYVSGLYARIWRYTSLFDLYAILSSVAISSGLSFIFIFFTMGNAGYPRSVLILYFILNSIFTTSTRLSVRIYYSHYYQGSDFKKIKKEKSYCLLEQARLVIKLLEKY